jgi:hypothetical protein
MTITTVDEGLKEYLKVYSGLVSIISDRVFLMFIPQSATLPCLVVSRIDTPRELCHDTVGATGALAHPRFQFDAWASTYAVSKAITDQVRAALQGHTGSIGYQTETATVNGTIINPGNATVIVTCTGMSGSPITANVAVSAADTASIVAGKIRTALGNVSNITSFLTVGGSAATVTLTRVCPGASITNFNIAVDNGTCSGLTAAPTSTETYNAINISAALVDGENPTYDAETGLYRGQSDFIVWHEE